MQLKIKNGPRALSFKGCFKEALELLFLRLIFFLCLECLEQFYLRAVWNFQ